LKLSISIENMPKALDPLWQYEEPEDGTNRQQLNCKLCGQHMTGGIRKLKYHLTKLPEHDLVICPRSSSKIMRVVHDLIHPKNKKKEEAATYKAEHTIRILRLSTTEGSRRGSTDSPTSKSSSFLLPQTKAGAQPSIMSVIKKREKAEADRVMGKCLFWSDLPLSITKSNPFLQPMCDAINVVGPRYKSDTYGQLQGPILQAKKDINSRLAKLKLKYP
jgi:hypothetical protein